MCGATQHVWCVDVINIVVWCNGVWCSAQTVQDAQGRILNAALTYGGLLPNSSLMLPLSLASPHLWASSGGQGGAGVGGGLHLPDLNYRASSFSFLLFLIVFLFFFNTVHLL